MNLIVYFFVCALLKMIPSINGSKVIRLQYGTGKPPALFPPDTPAPPDVIHVSLSFFFFQIQTKMPSAGEVMSQNEPLTHWNSHSMLAWWEEDEIRHFRISNQFWQCETAVLALDICNWWGRSDNTNSADMIWENAHISFVLYSHMNPNWCQLLHDLICKVEMWYRPTKSRMNTLSWIEFRLITPVN